MKIQITKAEYRLLLAALYAGVEYEESLADAWAGSRNKYGILKRDHAYARKARARADKYRNLRWKLSKQEPSDGE